MNQAKTKPRWPTSKSMQAFVAPVPHLYQIEGKSVPPGESWQCTTKTGDTYYGVNPKHSGKALTSIDVILKVPFIKQEAK